MSRLSHTQTSLSLDDLPTVLLASLRFFLAGPPAQGNAINSTAILAFAFENQNEPQERASMCIKQRKCCHPAYDVGIAKKEIGFCIVSSPYAMAMVTS